MFLKISLCIFTVLLASHTAEGGECTRCHSAEGGGKQAKKIEALARSAHRDLGCTDCHVDIEDGPHRTPPAKVDCGMCHTEVSETYTVHGRAKVPGKNIPTCKRCHGAHDILAPSDPKSKVHEDNLSDLCIDCHADVNLVREHHLQSKVAITAYRSSVHGAVLPDEHVAATCLDCHGVDSAHKIYAPSNTDSPIFHFNIPKTCGKCHEVIAKEYVESVHGQLAARGDTDAPICTNCHGEHGILAADDPLSPVSPSRVAESTCSPCHESARLSAKFGIPTGRLRSYIDTYHGLKSKAGDTTVANCASCHGAHRILAHTDPRSTIHPDNLQKTCGDCHPGISEALAESPVHAAPGTSQTPIAQIVADIYIVFVSVVIGSMLLYVLIDLVRRLQKHLRLATIPRMTKFEIAQHGVLFLSFTVLAVTGFALRFSDAGWAQFLFGYMGGFEMRGDVHRTAALVFVLLSLSHLLHMLTKRGRTFVRDMLPRFQDVTDAFAMVKYNLGRTSKHPRFGRFGFAEKAEYWALVWGTVIMTVTGTFLWFDNLAVQTFPKGFLDVMLVIHYYEAWLAVLAVLVWHFYMTVFRPGVYPMNSAWLTGKMRRELYVEEHPEDPILDDYPEERASKNEPI